MLHVHPQSSLSLSMGLMTWNARQWLQPRSCDWENGVMVFVLATGPKNAMVLCIKLIYLDLLEK